MTPKRWRTGFPGLLRETPAMIFEQSGGNAAEDKFIGLMADDDMADRAVIAHNALVERYLAQQVPFADDPVFPHESWQILIQPDNSLLTVFDLKKNSVVAYDATPERVFSMVKAYAATAVDYHIRGTLLRLQRGERAYVSPIPWRTVLAYDRAANGSLWQRYATKPAAEDAQEASDGAQS